MAVSKRTLRIRPSGMAPTVACPGSLMMQEKYPRVDSSNGDEGTLVHAIGADLLRGNGLLVPEGTYITDEMRVYAKYYADYVTSIAPIRDIRVEENIRLEAIHPDLCSGIPDATYFNADNHVLHIFDFKYGYGLVEAYENWQCLAYASGILGIEEHLKGKLDIYIHIVQPRAYHPLGPVRKWHLTLEQLKTYAGIMRVKVEEALSPNPLGFPGRQCKYCTARHVCDLLLSSTNHLMDTVEQVTPLDLTDYQVGKELSLLKKAKLLLDARITGLEAQVEQGAKRGKLYSGWTLEPGRGKVIWTKPKEEVFALGTLLGIGLQKDAEPITPNQAKDKGLNPDILNTFTRRIPGALKLKEIDINYGKQLFGD
ncbi:MAG: DUF2800 domain-containing protein [candidate division Zixibacteria bacterium]|nr:DUF2800 domain-containing protein [candidate division Zixibacteria bacterium]